MTNPIGNNTNFFVGMYFNENGRHGYLAKVDRTTDNWKASVEARCDANGPCSFKGTYTKDRFDVGFESGPNGNQFNLGGKDSNGHQLSAVFRQSGDNWQNLSLTGVQLDAILNRLNRNSSLTVALDADKPSQIGIKQKNGPNTFTANAVLDPKNPTLTATYSQKTDKYVSEASVGISPKGVPVGGGLTQGKNSISVSGLLNGQGVANVGVNGAWKKDPNNNLGIRLSVNEKGVSLNANVNAQNSDGEKLVLGYNAADLGSGLTPPKLTAEVKGPNGWPLIKP